MWSQLVNPETNYWHWYNTMTHGIHTSMVSNMPTFRNIYPRIKQSFARRVVISHSWFDEDAIRKACKHHRLQMFQNGWMDSIQMAKKAWPQRKGKGYGLRKLANYLGINYRAHDAGEDARVTAKIVLRAAAVIGPDLLRQPEFTVRGR